METKIVFKQNISRLPGTESNFPVDSFFKWNRILYRVTGWDSDKCSVIDVENLQCSFFNESHDELFEPCYPHKITIEVE